MVVASGLLAILIARPWGCLSRSPICVNHADLARETREGLVAADALQKLVIDLETGVRGYVITGEERFLEPWNDARAAFPSHAAKLEQLTADDAVEMRETQRIVQGIASYIRDYATPLVDDARRDEPSARERLGNRAGETARRRPWAEFARFRATERALLAAREDSADLAARRAGVAAAVGVAGSMILILLFAGYLTRVIVRPLRRAAQMADRLAGGDLSVRMPEDDVGEIGALERSFNAMAGSLEASEDDLRRLVEQQSALRRVATLVAHGRCRRPRSSRPSSARSVPLGCRPRPDGAVRSGRDGDRRRRLEQRRGRACRGTRIALDGVSIAALGASEARVMAVPGVPIRVENAGLTTAAPRTAADRYCDEFQNASASRLSSVGGSCRPAASSAAGMTSRGRSRISR